MTEFRAHWSINELGSRCDGESAGRHSERYLHREKGADISGMAALRMGHPVQLEGGRDRWCCPFLHKADPSSLSQIQLYPGDGCLAGCGHQTSITPMPSRLATQPRLSSSWGRFYSSFSPSALQVTHSALFFFLHCPLLLSKVLPRRQPLFCLQGKVC